MTTNAGTINDKPVGKKQRDLFVSSEPVNCKTSSEFTLTNPYLTPRHGTCPSVTSGIDH